MHSETARRPRLWWGLRLAPAESVRGRVVEHRWRWPTVLALASTIPAFYVELLHSAPSLLATLAYGAAALLVGAALVHTGWRSGRLVQHMLGNPLDLVLVVGLLMAAVLPPSIESGQVLGLRLAVSLLTLLRMVWAVQRLITRGSVAYLLMTSTLILGLCGVGFWWLEPRTPTLGDGLWLAFTTAATVGFGDIMPSTPASKIFSVFVVMLGYGVLSLVTAAIATQWVETEERIIEREILRDMHRQMDGLRHDIDALRRELLRAREHDLFVSGAAHSGGPSGPSAGGAVLPKSADRR